MLHKTQQLPTNKKCLTHTYWYFWLKLTGLRGRKLLSNYYRERKGTKFNLWSMPYANYLYSIHHRCLRSHRSVTKQLIQLIDINPGNKKWQKIQLDHHGPGCRNPETQQRYFHMYLGHENLKTALKSSFKNYFLNSDHNPWMFL